MCDMADVNQAAGKQWILTRLNESKVGVANPPTLKFDQGKLAVFGGVNRLAGAYALVDNRVVMGQLVSTQMAGPPERMELEKEFAKALAAVDAFHVDGDQLELLSKGTVVAQFRAGE